MGRVWSFHQFFKATNQRRYRPTPVVADLMDEIYVPPLQVKDGFLEFA